MAHPHEHHVRPGLHLLQWMLAVLGLVLVVGATGFMVYRAVGPELGPPALSVRWSTPLRQQDGWLLPFTAINDGGQAAAQVWIEASIIAGDGSREVSRTVLDYVPAHSERRGGLVFRTEPRADRLTIRALGYAEP